MIRLLEAGRLNKRVTLQSRSDADDGGGGSEVTYADAVSLDAAIEPGQGREFVQAQQLVPELSHTVTIRFRKSVTPKHRFKYVANGEVRLFAIHAMIDPEERHEQLVLLCSEVTPT